MAREWLKNFDFSESGSDKKLPFSKLKEDYAVSSSGGSIQHPYAAHMTEWNALKADAAGMGLADNYGLPTQQYYAYKGKPQWMIADDEADRQRTAEQYPAAQAAEVQKSPALIDFKSLQVTNPEVTPYKQTRALSYTDWLNQSTTNGNMGGGSGAQFAPKEDKEVTWKDLYPAYVDRAMQNVSYPAYDTAPQGDNTTLAGRIATASTMDELNQLEGEVNLMNPSAGVVYRGGSRAGGVYDQRVKSENAEQFSLLDRIAKRKEWLQGINADTVNKKYQNPLSLLQTEHEQKNKEITGRYDAEITPDQRLAYLQSLGYSSEEEAMADPDYYLKSANLPAQWAQQEIFDTGRENIDYLKKYQSTSDMRDITKNGLAETPSEFARVEYVTQTENDKVRDIEGPYDSPFFQPNNGLYEDYNPSKSTMEGYTKNFINSEIQKWQGRYDDLAADESGVKASGNQDAISEWKFRMATASYNLANAKGQLLLMNPDAKSRVDAAKTSTENPVAHPEEVRNATQAWFNLPLKLAEADANEIYNLSDAMYPSEKQIYNYLYGDGSGKAEADAYFESIRSSVEFRAAQKRQEKTAERGGSLLNIPETFPKQIYGTASTIGTSIGAALAGKDVNPYDPRFGQSREVEQLRTQVIQAAPAVTQGPLSAAISLGDMATAFSVGGGVTGMSVIMSSEAGAGTVLETLDNGGDIQTAVLNGMGSAAVEYFTERLGTGERFMNLFKNPGSVENFMKTFAKSFGAEAVEEVPGWLYGQVTDSMLLGAKSEYNRALVYYADTMGLSPEQAEKKADQDAMAQLFNQMYAAGLAGAAGGGVAYVAGNINAGNVSKDLQGRIDISPKSADAISRAMVMGEEIPADALSEYQAAITGQANAPESVLQSELNGREPDRQNVVEPNFYDEAFAQTADNAPESPVQRVNDVEAPTYPTVDMEAAGANFAPSRNPFTTKAATDTGMVTVEGISSVGSGAKVKLSDGSTAPVADMEFDDSGMGSLYRVAAAFSSPTEANTFLGFYEGSNLPAASYMQGYMDYYTAGSQGRPVSTLNGSIYAALLDEDTRQFAYTQGRATRQTAAKTAWGDFYTDIKEGQSGVVKAYIRKNMNNEQKAKLTLLDQNAKRFGLQIVVSDTLGANNGMYGGGRTVYVGLDAIDGGITKAASHEFLHYVREQDEGSYTELKNIILDAVGQEKINTRIQEEIKRHADAGIDLTEDGALEELVAQGLPDVILNTKTAERMARENLPLAKKLAAWLRDFVKRWNETFKGSPEAEALRKRGDKYEQALKAFEGALEKVKAETVTESNGQSIEEGKAAEAVKNSLKSADTTDSEGNPLTPEQVEFFKDSKVRDENGALIPVYHGTPNEFTAFDNSFANRVKAFFFSDKIEAGKTYGNRVVEAYLNLNTPLVVDAKGENWQEVKFKFDDDLYPVRTTVDRLAEHAKKSGYDGLIVLNVRDNSTKSYSGTGNDYIAFSPNQIKSITNTAPTTAPDMRFSLKSTAPLLAEEEEYATTGELRDAVKYLKDQFRTTKGIKLRPEDVQKVARKVISETSSTYDLDTFIQELSQLFDFIANEPGINYDDVVNHTADLAMKVLEKSSKLVETGADSKAIRRLLRDTSIRLTSSQKEEAAYLYGSYNEFRKGLFGSARISEKGTYLDMLWADFSEKFPSAFPKDASEGDMVGILYDAARGSGKVFENPYGMDLEGYARDLALNILGKYQADVRTLPPTFADKQKAELEKARKGFDEAMSELHRYYQDKVLAVKEAAKEREQQGRENRADASRTKAVINDIIKTATGLKKKLLTDTEKSHIPEGMKSATLTMLQALDFSSGRSGAATNAFVALQNEFQKLRDGGVYAETELAGVYDFSIDSMLDLLQSTTKNKRINQLDAQELSLVRDIVKYINHVVTTEGKLFAEGRNESVADLGETIKADLYARKQRKEWGMGGVGSAVQNMLQSGLMTPDTMFWQFRDNPIYYVLYMGLRDRLDVHIDHVAFIEGYLRGTMEKYGYKKWDTKAVQEFKTTSGATLNLTLDHLLTIYATSKREAAVESNHMTGDGIKVRDQNMKEVNRVAVQLTPEDIARMRAMLTDDQMAYADRLIAFNSSTAADWGNQTSMQMLGIRKYTEKYYIPFVTNSDYTKKSPGMMGDIRLANRSFTKKLTQQARTAIDILPFTQLWANHAEQMSMYASFAAPLADITRVLNYRGDIGSVRESINAAFTNHTVKYIDNFLTDLNGGAITPVGQGMIDKMLGGAKRGAVAANLSVAIQQASAGVRAKAEIDAKYFLPAQVSGLRYRRAYAELLKYSPTAQLKQWGYFDTSMTRTIYQRAKGGVMQSIQDKASWMAQQGDMLNWAQIWEAVKNEQRDITGLEGEELLQTAAKRFREVIDKTQVVDSVFHRSEWARSKGAAKLLTSFMSEPIQMYNMLYRAKVMASNGDNGTAAKYVGSVAASMVLNAALSAVVGALRDRDNDKRDAKHNIIGVRGFSDKYTDAFLDRLVSAPFSLLPFVSDAYDMWKGYDATNLFMLPIQKVINAERGIEGLITGKTDWWTALKKTLDAGSMATGIPVYNVIRDAESLINTGIETVKRDTLLGMAYDTTQPISVRLAAARANVDPAKKPGLYYDMLTVATMGGQENEQEAIRAVLKETGRTDSTIDSTIQGRVREAEPLVQAAAKVVVANDVRGQKAGIDALVNAGYEKEMSVAMVRSEANYIENQAAKLAGLEGAEREKFLKDSRYDEAYLKGVELPKESEEGEGNAPSMYRYSALMNAIQSGNDSDIMTVMKQFQSEGKSLSTIKAQVTGYFKPIYYAAHVRGDEAAKKSIRDMLTKYFDYKVGKVNVFTNKRETNDFDNWLEESYKKDMWTAIENGDASALAAIRKDMQKYMSFSESREAIKKKYAKEYFTLSADEQAAVRKALTGIGISEELIARWARASK